MDPRLTKISKEEYTQFDWRNYKWKGNHPRASQKEKYLRVIPKAPASSILHYPITPYNVADGRTLQKCMPPPPEYVKASTPCVPDNYNSPIPHSRTRCLNKLQQTVFPVSTGEVAHTTWNQVGTQQFKDEKGTTTIHQEGKLYNLVLKDSSPENGLQGPRTGSCAAMEPIKYMDTIRKPPPPPPKLAKPQNQGQPITKARAPGQLLPTDRNMLLAYLNKVIEEATTRLPVIKFCNLTEIKHPRPQAYPIRHPSMDQQKFNPKYFVRSSYLTCAGAESVWRWLRDDDAVSKAFKAHEASRFEAKFLRPSLYQECNMV